MACTSGMPSLLPPQPRRRDVRLRVRVAGVRGFGRRASKWRRAANGLSPSFVCAQLADCCCCCRERWLLMISGDTGTFGSCDSSYFYPALRSVTTTTRDEVRPAAWFIPETCRAPTPRAPPRLARSLAHGHVLGRAALSVLAGALLLCFWRFALPSDGSDAPVAERLTKVHQCQAGRGRACHRRGAPRRKVVKKRVLELATALKRLTTAAQKNSPTSSDGTGEHLGRAGGTGHEGVLALTEYCNSFVQAEALDALEAMQRDPRVGAGRLRSSRSSCPQSGPFDQLVCQVYGCLRRVR